MSTEIPEKSGCGIQVLYNGVFGRKCARPRRTVSTNSIPTHKINNIITHLKLRRTGSEDTALILEKSTSQELLSSAKTKSQSMHQRKSSTSTKTSSTSSSNSVTIPRANSTSTLPRSLSKDYNSLVRVSSGNIIPLSQLRKQPAVVKNSNSISSSITNNGVLGNIMMKENSVSLSKTLVNPDTLKMMGNEEYKKGKFSEALILYNGAIALNSENACYRSNKSAALIGLGRLLEALFECREAVKIDPFYRRAHYRLATLFIRLGEGEKGLYHFKKSGFEANSLEISKAQVLEAHVNKCTEAKIVQNWNELLKESKRAILLGADSSPLITSWQAEALLKLHRHQDADNAMTKLPTFDIDHCTKFYGPNRNAQILLIRARVDMAAGRFEEAVSVAKQALQLDLSNKEVNSVVYMIRNVSLARSSGNKLFKESKFALASAAYSEGLEHVPFNSVLLCNRAACRIKLNQFEKAMEDCSIALNVRPCYSKARLRRAECNAKMERWVAAVQDYEILIRENPRDGDLAQAFLVAQAQIKIQRSPTSSVVVPIRRTSRLGTSNCLVTYIHNNKVC
ncbi:hypothetical protein ACHQM5_022445 [Ranunculus cassubicifolius]